MPRKGHSEERIIYALKQIEGGAKGLSKEADLIPEVDSVLVD